jgi:hypothetical protein
MVKKPMSPKQREKRRATYLTAWREKHREENLAYNKQWREKNRERVNEMQRKRRTRREAKPEAAE